MIDLDLHPVFGEIYRERQRQIVVEGYGRFIDDQYHDDELSLAALCYLQAIEKRRHGTTEGTIASDPPDMWPWEDHFWKPKDNRRDLIRAAALIIAELERMDRAAAHA